MRVLWVNEAADFVGGCEQYIFNTARLLQDHGVQSSLLYDCRQPFSTDFVKPFDQAFPMVDISVQVADINPDLIYVHRLSGRKVIEDLRNTGVPTVRFFHDTKLFCPREHRYTPFRHRTCNRPMGWRCYPCLGFINRSDSWPGISLNLVSRLRNEIQANRGLDAYVVASDYMATLLGEHGISLSRTHIIPLYAQPPDDEEPVAREKDLFLFVGQLVRSKGIDTLLRAMTLTKRPCSLCIVGQGRQEQMFRALANNLGLDGRVRFLGKVQQEALSSWYWKATCVVLPVRQPESFALVGPEAMSRGTPVIATNIGGINTWLENGRTGLTVHPNDPRALAQAMDTITSEIDLRDSMGKNARRRYEERFKPERHVHALLDVFGLLVGKGVQL